MAGAFSAVFTTPILAPGERVKCLLQTQAGDANAVEKSTVDVCKELYAEGGLRSVCRGFAATMARDSVASFFYFSS
jgi:solute carrier family 25 carnitine/acylcarnitine transporter 20/29